MYMNYICCSDICIFMHTVYATATMYDYLRHAQIHGGHAGYGITCTVIQTTNHPITKPPPRYAGRLYVEACGSSSAVAK